MLEKPYGRRHNVRRYRHNIYKQLGGVEHIYMNTSYFKVVLKTTVPTSELSNSKYQKLILLVSWQYAAQ